MEILIYFLIFVFGLIIGSFLNSVIYRLSIKKDFLFGKSQCPNCNHVLSWYDLIPLASFLILKGKCRYCKNPISIQYPLVEFITGALFVLLTWQSIDLLASNALFGFLRLCFLLLISCFLIIIFVYDFKHYIIPDKIIFPAILIIGSWYLLASIAFDFYTKNNMLNGIYSALGASLFFLFIVLVSRGKWMGMGDVKLAFFMGLFLGFPKIITALFLAFFIGAVIGVILIFSGKKNLKSEIPFGPFLVVGTFLTLFFEHEIINFYLSVYY
jgi:leader peptidase (prepilin peptidase)/N-methyltransferase